MMVLYLLFKRCFRHNPLYIRRVFGKRPFVPIDPTTGLYCDNPHVNEVAHFADCCRNGEEPISNGHDNLGTMKILYDICESSHRREMVEPSERYRSLGRRLPRLLISPAANHTLRGTPALSDRKSMVMLLASSTRVSTPMETGDMPAISRSQAGLYTIERSSGAEGQSRFKPRKTRAQVTVRLNRTSIPIPSIVSASPEVSKWVCFAAQPNVN